MPFTATAAESFFQVTAMVSLLRQPLDLFQSRWCNSPWSDKPLGRGFWFKSSILDYLAHGSRMISRGISAYSARKDSMECLAFVRA